MVPRGPQVTQTISKPAVDVRIDQVARLAVVAQDRVQAAAGFDHEAEPVLAGVGIFPAEQALAGPGRCRDVRKTTNRLPVGGHSARNGQQGLAVEPEHRPGVAVDRDARLHGAGRGSTGRASAGRPARFGQSRTRPSASVTRCGSSARRRIKARARDGIFPAILRSVFALRAPQRARSLPDSLADSSSAGPASLPAGGVAQRGVAGDRRLRRDPVEIVDEPGQQPLVEPALRCHCSRTVWLAAASVDCPTVFTGRDEIGRGLF